MGAHRDRRLHTGEILPRPPLISDSSFEASSITASYVSSTPPSPGPWLGAFVAGMAGWTLDGFDFFLVILSLADIGRTFGKSIPHMALTAWATLALRPIGAFLFGSIADRYGRRVPMVANLVFFAVIELACSFAPSFTMFILLRALFGIVMGGQWGVGVSLAMEKVPSRYRGVLSGLLQQGYSLGFLLAAGAYFFIDPKYGWRPLFYLGSIPALAVAALVILRVTESEAWIQHHASSFRGLGRAIRSHWKLLGYFIVFMMSMHMISHGTQDLYPTFLRKQWRITGKEAAELTAISVLGAIFGGLLIGWISDRTGRRRAMVSAIAGALLCIPLWAFAQTPGLLVLGAVLMQFFVQGAWGVVPAYVAELSPDAVRGTLPGLGNQIGVLIAGGLPFLEATLAGNSSYSIAMSISAAVVFCLAIVMTLAGRGHNAIELQT